MDSKQIPARFELAHQALAVMSHSAIAKVYDAGMTKQGQPYLVMEQVEANAARPAGWSSRLMIPPASVAG